MTAVEMGALFDLLQDKYNQPYFNNSEKSELLNLAQINIVQSVVNGILEADKDVERSHKDLNDIYTLVCENLPYTTPSSGLITDSNLSTILDTRITAYPGPFTSMGCIAVQTSTGEPIRYVRYNDRAKFSQNIFKAPSSTKRYWSYNHEGIILFPNEVVSVEITLVKKPEVIDIDGTSDTDMPIGTHEKIVVRALKIAGVITEDESSVVMDKII